MSRFLRPLLALLCAYWTVISTLSGAAQQEQRLHYGETVEGYLTAAAAEQRWYFAGNSGDRVLIDMRPADASGLDTFLTLLDPQGNTLASDDDSGEGTNARIGPLILSQDGDYTILADRYDGAGAYLLTVYHLALLPTLAPDKPLIGALDGQHPADAFALDPGERRGQHLLRLSVRDDDPASNPILSVYGPEGLLTSTEESGADEIDPLPVTGAGPYVVLISWKADMPGVAYELWLTDSQVSLLVPGEPIEVPVSPGGGSRYFFQAEGGATVRLTATAAAGIITPALVVTSLADGQPLFSASGTYTRALSVTLDIPIAGYYQLDVNSGATQGPPGLMILLLERDG